MISRKGSLASLLQKTKWLIRILRPAATVVSSLGRKPDEGRGSEELEMNMMWHKVAKSGGLGVVVGDGGEVRKLVCDLWCSTMNPYPSIRVTLEKKN